MKRGAARYSPLAESSRQLSYSVLRTMEKKAAPSRRVAEVAPAFELRPEPPANCHDWLVDDPHSENLRELDHEQRAALGIRKWKLPPRDGPATIVYERAAGRVVKTLVMP